MGRSLMKIYNLVAIATTMALIGFAQAEDGTTAKHGTLKSKTAESQFTFNGRLMFDWDAFDGAHNTSNNGSSGNLSEIRRARFAVTSQLNKHWKAKLQINFDEKKQSDIKDAYIQNKGSMVTTTIGKHKEPMGLEELTSSKYITTIERAMVTDALAPSRSVGVSWKGNIDNLLLQGGVFRSTKDSNNSKKETYALTGRAVYTPVKEVGNIVHLGLSISQRNLGGNRYKFSERAEIHTADKIVSSATIDADSMTILGLEAALVKGAFSVQAEYLSANIAANSGADGSFDGYYVLGSYFLTGESRAYKAGQFAKVKPNANNGAWELVARYSNLDGRDNGEGVLGKNLTLGVNYYLSASMRFMLNYLNTDLTSNVVLAQNSGNGISARFQYIW
jgi:phosphate-selective porin OprO and OprP